MDESPVMLCRLDDKLENEFETDMTDSYSIVVWFGVSHLLQPNDFEVFRRDRGSDPHGGVLIACRRSLVGSIVHIGKTTEFIGIKVKLIHGKKHFISNNLSLSLGL
jgi:hypothetical protein